MRKGAHHERKEGEDPMTVDELREHARRASTPGPDGPSDVPAADVLPFMDDDDRNVRVAALRVLAWTDGPDAVRGLLKGLDDPKRRVRDVAAKSCVRFASEPRIAARLLQAVEEEDRASAASAIEVLSGGMNGWLGLASDGPVLKAVEALADHPKFRQRALSALLRASALDDKTTALLQRFVKDGSKDEAVFATRRLDGFRIVHDAELTDEQRGSAERAHGRVWYWVRVPEG
jgi:hypothetical protein